MPLYLASDALPAGTSVDGACKLPNNTGQRRFCVSVHPQRRGNYVTRQLCGAACHLCSSRKHAPQCVKRHPQGQARPGWRAPSCRVRAQEGYGTLHGDASYIVQCEEKTHRVQSPSYVCTKLCAGSRPARTALRLTAPFRFRNRMLQRGLLNHHHRIQMKQALPKRPAPAASPLLLHSETSDIWYQQCLH